MHFCKKKRKGVWGTHSPLFFRKGCGHQLTATVCGFAATKILIRQHVRTCHHTSWRSPTDLRTAQRFFFSSSSAAILHTYPVFALTAISNLEPRPPGQNIILCVHLTWKGRRSHVNRRNQPGISLIADLEHRISPSCNTNPHNVS